MQNEVQLQEISDKDATTLSIIESIEQSPPPEDRFGHDPKTEFGLLPQLNTRQISHTELAVEVKAIYAGLAVVETKCIGSDEEQAAAAREKDLCKSKNLENGQWQSLIALHREVHTLSRRHVPTTHQAAFTDCMS